MSKGCAGGAPDPVTGLCWQTVNPMEPVAEMELKYRCFSCLSKCYCSMEISGQKELILEELYATEVSFSRKFFLMNFLSNATVV